LEKNFVESGEAAFDASALFLGGFGALEEVERDVADGGEVGRSVALADALLRDEATVDDQFGAGDEGGFVGRQEQHPLATSIGSPSRRSGVSTILSARAPALVAFNIGGM
jgi:hypothetical protein